MSGSVFAIGSVIENVTSRDRSNPASIRVRLYTVCTSNPAPNTSITANATCAAAVANYGKATARGSFQTPRRYRISAIFRF